VQSGSGTVSSILVNGVGNNYYGSYVPVILPTNSTATGFLSPTGSAATISGVTTNASGALTGITIAPGSTNYASAPTLNFGASTAGLTGALAPTALVAGFSPEYRWQHLSHRSALFGRRQLGRGGDRLADLRRQSDAEHHLAGWHGEHVLAELEPNSTRWPTRCLSVAMSL